MKIYLQEDENDCGISVTRSLVYHFFKKEISREEIIDQLNITPSGISIFELESINRKYGIYLDSYHITLTELEEMNVNTFFILMLYRENKEHFVISKKNGKNIILYDSEQGKLKLKIKDLSPVFSEKILLIEKVVPPPESTSYQLKNESISILQYPKLFKTIFTELITFTFLVLNYFLNKFIIQDVVNSESIENISVILFSFMILLMNWTIAEYIKDIFYLKDIQWYYKYLYQLLISKLEMKKNYFFSKLSNNKLLMINQYIENISSFFGKFLSLFLSNSIISIFLTIYLIFLHPFFLFLIIFSLIIKACNFLFLKKQDELYLHNSWKNNLNIQQSLYSINNFLQNEWDFNKFKFLNKILENSIIERNIYEKKLQSKKILNNTVNFLITHIVNISVYLGGSYLYLHHSMNLSSLIFSGIIYTQLNYSLEKIFSIGILWNKFTNSLIKLKNLIFQDNIEDESKLTIGIPEKIELKNLNYHNGAREIFQNLNLTIYPNTFLIGKSGIGKSTLLNLISCKITNSEKSIFFDQIEISNLKNSLFNQLVIYQNSHSELSYINWDKLFQQIDKKEIDIVKEISQKLQIAVGENFLNTKLSKGQTQFINILNLLQYSKKILLLDEITSHINSEIKSQIYTSLFPLISSKNFVVCTEHDLQLQTFFKHSINLNETIFQ